MRQDVEIAITIGGVSMTTNATKVVKRISTYGVVITFCILVFLSFVDVVPSAEDALEITLCCVATIFVVFIVSLIFCALRRNQRS